MLRSFSCTSCHVNKSHKLPFSFNSMSSTQPLQFIYTDVWTSPALSVDGFKYYVNFVDHFTKYIWLFPLKLKFEVSTVFVQFKTMIENYFGFKIISVFSDNGGEYTKLTPILNNLGVTHYTSPPKPRNIMGQLKGVIDILWRMAWHYYIMPLCRPRIGHTLFIR